jgi:hypothetical protein
MVTFTDVVRQRVLQYCLLHPSHHMDAPGQHCISFCNFNRACFSVMSASLPTAIFRRGSAVGRASFDRTSHVHDFALSATRYGCALFTILLVFYIAFSELESFTARQVL